MPPGAPNPRVDAKFELSAHIVPQGLDPHMHGRRYRFAWQHWYNLKRPLALQKGSGRMGDQRGRMAPAKHFAKSGEGR